MGKKKSSEIDKRKQGRPPKWEAFTLMMEKVLEGEEVVGNAIIHTDMELLDMVNEQLPEAQRISGESFKSYKAGEVDDETIAGVFVTCYKRAMRIQRESLMAEMTSDIPGGWQKWAWIMERKFDEWNLRSKSINETPDFKRLVMRVGVIEVDEEGEG